MGILAYGRRSPSPTHPRPAGVDQRRVLRRRHLQARLRCRARTRTQFHSRGFTYRSPIVRLRQALDRYVCQRPCRAFHANPLNYRAAIDIVVFRENTEGMYSGVEYPRIPDILRSEPAIRKLPGDAGISIRTVSAHSSRRIVDAAFQFALKHGRRKVTAVHKANMLRATCGAFLEAAEDVAAR
jgi:3-isopropylmalate dehydrogenase